MIRMVGGSVLLSLALMMPAQPTAAQDPLTGGLLGAGAGAIIGGAATGRAGGAVAGAIIGGAAGAIIGSEAERRRGHYWWHGDCYRAVRGGYVMVHRRYCY